MLERLNGSIICCVSEIRFGFIVGALITAGVLTAGLISFKTGNSQLGQTLMRARVVAQGGTVALMVGTAAYYGEKF
ncbi:putative hypoxia induced protein [Helianthus annuus]|nr:putative hypoxia induced protein [Helianthus annuus]KAJ0543514.1 putative hypoxia induced protein [Helianthus annuus]KAJ0708566.1 putative hypoxia induced protein [Helianthus annuus]KAJ0754499.1 putative hypoxia induced protein [Helianthus annuus]